jgi:hypothetical protein
LKINDFSIVFVSLDTKTNLLLSDSLGNLENSIFEFEHFTLSQLGSGGEHWQSPIHWNENKESTAIKQGFDLKGNDDQTIEGLRAEPVVLLGAENSYIQIALEQCWQNFRLSLGRGMKVTNGSYCLKKTELRGGKSKTWTFKCRS